MAILARGDIFPDSLSGAPLAFQHNCPILLTPSASLQSATAEEIKRLGSEEIIILGSGDAIYTEVVTELEQKCHLENAKIHRLGGKDRYETAELIAQQLTGSSLLKTREAFLATGENFPDALCAAPLAAFQNSPIFLVSSQTNTLPDSIVRELDQKKIKNLVIMGSSDVISNNLELWCQEHSFSTSRIGGESRYNTAIAMANYALSAGLNERTIFLTRGDNFPDALTGAVLAAKLKSPLILVKPQRVPDFVYDWINSHFVETAILLGDREAISRRVEESIKTGQRIPNGPLSFETDQAMEYIKYLTNTIGPRGPGTAEENQAAAYLSEKSLNFGYEDVTLQPFNPYGDLTSYNVIAIKPGETERTFVIGAHYDSKASTGSPGGNDNASGVGVLMEIAQDYLDVPLSNTLIFVAFGSEEYVQGDHFRGSYYFYHHLDRNISGMINLDCVGNPGPAITIGDLGSRSWLIDLALKSGHNLGYPVYYKVQEGNSDYRWFCLAGIPVADLACEDDPLMHTPLDNYSNVNPTLIEMSGRILNDLLVRL